LDSDEDEIDDEGAEYLDKLEKSVSSHLSLVLTTGIWDAW
jgi:hypothetical protein